jgi:hypothetical protein
MKIAGCDCGKDSLTICLLTELPKEDFKRFSRRYKPLIVKANREGLTQLLELQADIYAIEPTGSYSRLWIERLREAEKELRIINSSKVKNLLRMHGIANKSDRIDAAGIAYFTYQNHAIPHLFLSPSTVQVKEWMLNREALNKSSVMLKNRINARLCYECPEILQRLENTQRDWGDPPPTILYDLIGEDIDLKMGRHSRDRRQIIADTIGSGISEQTKQWVQQLIEITVNAFDIEIAIDDGLQRSEFERYNRIFDRFDCPSWLRAVLIGSIFPFEKFLDEDGRRRVEYIPKEKGTGTTKRDRSEGAFKLSCGQGKVLHQSGDVWEWKAGGSALCRKSCWLYVKSRIVMQRHSAHSDREVYRTLIQRHKQPKLHPWLNEKVIEAVAQATGVSPEVASLRVHFECSTKKGDRRVSSTAGRFIRMLYKACVQEFC